MSEAELRDLQRSVDELVEEALSARVNLNAMAPPHIDIDETERVTIYVLRQIGPPRGLRVMPEPQARLISSMVLQELQRRDVLAGRDPSDRITDDHRRWLAGYLSEVTAGWQDDQERGSPPDH